MKEPRKPFPPNKRDYSAKFTEEPIMNIEFITNEDQDLEEYLEDWKDQNDWEEGDPVHSIPVFEYFKYKNSLGTLAELLAKVPTGIDPKDVYLSLSRDRGVDYVGFSMIFRKPTDQDKLKKDFDDAQSAYNEAEKQYQKDLAVYQEWYAADAIAKKEQELQDLKKKLGK